MAAISSLVAQLSPNLNWQRYFQATLGTYLPTAKIRAHLLAQQCEAEHALARSDHNCDCFDA